MNWEQKMEACQAIGEMSLRMRKPGDWYVHHSNVEKKDDHVLCGGCVIGAKSPQEAVEQHWEWLTSGDDGDRVVINAMRETRREVRWNGFMWIDVPRAA